MTAPLSFTGLIVIVTLPNEKLRLVPLTLKQSARVRRFVTGLHGGNLHIDTRDLIVMTEADALETFGKLTGKLPVKERLRRAFRRLFKGKPKPE